jgi:hypothetical protein
MSDDMEQPPLDADSAKAADAAAQPAVPRSRWRSRLKIALLLVIVVPILVAVLYTWSALKFAYATGAKTGYVQKFSKEGWLCKTWEGELAMVNLPGALPEIFHFTVRNDSIADLITKTMGQNVAITYEEHRGVPTSCFGDTPYYVTGVRSTMAAR